MPALPHVGDRFGRYAIEDEIGRGGMGVVFGATDTSLGRRVALKVVSADLGGSDEFRLRFEREATVLARLDSPHVIAIFDHGTQDDCPYIATQLIRGGDLGAYLHRHGPLLPADALRLCAQVADALDDAHRAGVVHRDVKPTNVLLRDADPEPGEEPYVYLCDFGIARTAGEGLTTPGSVAGTWSYLAPECGRGAAATPSSDIYAVGCLLWAALTGLPPYRGTDVQIAVAHQHTEVRRLPGDSLVVGAVNAVLQRAMAKNPGDRHTDADQLRTDLLRAAGLPGARDPLPPVPPGDPGTLAQVSPASPPVPAAPAGAAYAPSGWTPTPTPAPTTARTAAASGRRRSVVPVVAVAAVVAVLGGGGAGLLLTRGGGDDPGPRGATSSGGAPTSSAPTGAPPTSAAVTADGPIAGDLDGDGFGDVSIDYTADTGAILTATWSSTGKSPFGPARTDPLAAAGQGRSAWRLQGQLDDDGTADVLEFHQPQRNGPVTVGATLSGGASVDAVLPGGGRPEKTYDALGDVDGDGVDDLLWLQPVGDRTGLEVSTLAFDGTTFATAQKRLELPYTYTWPGDVDGDGVVDLVSLPFDGETDDDFNETGSLDIRLGHGDGTWADPITTPVALESSDVLLRTGDVDGDGAAEVVVGVKATDFVDLTVFDVADGKVTTRPDVGNVRYDNLDQLGPTLSVSDVNGDHRDDVVSIGTIRPSGTGRILVGISNGTTFTTSRWLAWNRTFGEDKADGSDDARFEPLEDARW